MVRVVIGQEGIMTALAMDGVDDWVLSVDGHRAAADLEVWLV